MEWIGTVNDDHGGIWGKAVVVGTKVNTADDLGTGRSQSNDSRPLLTLGEVHTGLLQNSTFVTRPQSVDVLSLLPGERVRQSERPIAFAVSPDLLTGVDCRLPSRSGTRTRGVGTAVSRASLTGGHVLQGSTFTRITRTGVNRRLPWSHYLAQPGAVETIGKADCDDVEQGFIGLVAPGQELDLGAISGRVMDQVQKGAGLDHTPPFRAARTRLRWSLGGPGEDTTIRFTIESETVRTVRVRAADGDVTQVAELCEDLALHDWLLTTLLVIIERSRIGTSSRMQVMRHLRPAIDVLLHLWMPAARVNRSVSALWEQLERRPGFSRQWTTSVDRIRDQVAVSTVALLSAVADNAERTGRTEPSLAPW